MKLKTIQILCAILFFAFISQAQTADQIITKNIKARGGYKRLKAIKTYSSFGTYSEFDATGKKLYTIEARSDRQLPDKKRASWLAKDLNVEGAEGYDGVNPPWEFDFIAGKGKLSNEEGAKASKRGVSISESFIDYQQRGNKVEFVGKEKLEGKEVFALKITLQDGLEQFYYLDAKTYLVFARRDATPLHAQGNPIESITFYDDYRPVNGFLFYFHHVQKNTKTGAKMAEGIDTRIEGNLKLEADWFKIPTVKVEEKTKPVSVEKVISSEQWRTDLRFLAEEMPKQHKNLFHTMTREQFENAVKKLDAQIPNLSRQQIIVEMARIVAMVGDGHTILSPARDPKVGFRTFPIKLYVFNDGVFVRSATRDQAKLIGARLVKIGNVSISEAYESVKQIIGRDNEMDIKFFAPFLLTMPEVLNGLGLIDEMQNVKFAFEDDEKQWTVDLKPLGKAEMITPDTDNSWIPKDGWIDARESSQSPTPLWLKDPNNKFWFEYLPDSKTLYFQLNQVGDKENENLESFVQRLFAFAETKEIDKFVLDLRLNRGGNNYLNRALLLGIIRATKIDQKGKFFTIIGRSTWSAAQMLTNDLERFTNTTFVGEPSGGKVNHYGDSRKIILPNSEITVRVSSLWWQQDERDKRQWTEPNIKAELSFTDYQNNRDPALEAILSYQIKP